MDSVNFPSVDVLFRSTCCRQIYFVFIWYLVFLLDISVAFNPKNSSRFISWHFY